MRLQFNQVLKELIIRHREFFETQLALTLIEDKDCIESVVALSNKLITVFQQNTDEIIAIINVKPKLIKELYHSDYFGRLNYDDQLTPYQQMLSALKQAAEDPIRALHVQMCFIHRIYDEMALAKTKPHLARKKFWARKIFTPGLFSDRARISTPSPKRALSKIGICTLAFFSKKISIESEHLAGKYKYTPNKNSQFYKSSFELLLPTICGPSGHTGSLILLAALFGSFDRNQWQDYSLIAASFLVIAGCHSYHECMLVAKKANVKYRLGDYTSMLTHKRKLNNVNHLINEHEHLIHTNGGNHHVQRSP